MNLHGNVRTGLKSQPVYFNSYNAVKSGHIEST